MSDLRTTHAEPYAFPIMTRLDDSRRAADRAREAQLEAAFNDAIAKGTADGIAQGRLEAQLEAQQLLEQSRREGLERGHADGLAEMREAASALRDALTQLEIQRAQIVSEAEAFCVDIAVEIVARLVEADSVRIEFVLRSVKSALKALAPENPTAIFLHPNVRKHLDRATRELPVRDDDRLATGSSRVEASRLLVQSSIDEAFEQIRCAVLELKANRQAALQDSVQGGADASDG
jgi:flagellar biosynthesis/type III secretory pathway protein FliH